MLLEVFRNHGLNPRKVGGREYAGPCPACGGDDRCKIWPSPDAARKRGAQGRYWCRQCGAHGDAINFLMEYDNMTYTQACAQLRFSPSYSSGTGQAPASSSRFTRQTSAGPTAQWQAQALKLVDEAHAELLNHSEQLAWLAARGISLGAVRRFRLGFVAGEKGQPHRYRPRASWGLPNLQGKDGKQIAAMRIPRGLLIPCMVDGQVLRLNIRRPNADYINEKTDKAGQPQNGSKYHFIPGGNMRPMLIAVGGPCSPPLREGPGVGDINQTKAWVVVESELDAIMLASQLESSALPVGFIGLRTARVSNLEEPVYQALEKSVSILVALDFDQAGRAAWEAWPATFAQAKRWPVPAGKDPGEAFALGRDMVEWVRLGLPPVLTLKPASSSQAPLSGQGGAGLNSAALAVPSQTHTVSKACPHHTVKGMLSAAEEADFAKTLNTWFAAAQAWLQPRLAELKAKGWTEAGLFGTPASAHEKANQPDTGWPYGGWGIAWLPLWLKEARREILPDGTIEHIFYDQQCRLNNGLRTVLQKPNCGV